MQTRKIDADQKNVPFAQLLEYLNSREAIGLKLKKKKKISFRKRDAAEGAGHGFRE